MRDFLNPERDELYHLKADPEESKNRIDNTRDPAVRSAISTVDGRIREKMRRLRDPVLGRSNE